jgi:molybdopterin-guanine dinucleotide biosynthesis protein A
MGMPKAWLTLREQPILRYLMSQIDWHGPKLLVTSPGREHPPASDLFDREIVDVQADQGPLQGVVTALQHVETDDLIALTCDMPLVQKWQLHWMMEQLHRRPDSRAIMLARRAQGQARIEPFPIALRACALPLLQEKLDSVDRSIFSLCDRPGFAALPPPADWPAEMWTNLNHPADLAAFEKAITPAPSSSARRCP